MNNLLFFILPRLIIILVGIYIFFTVKRAITFILPDKNKRYQYLLSALIAAVIIAPAINIWGDYAIWSIAVFHFFIFTLLTQLINFVLHKFFTDNNLKKWTKIYRLALIPIICTILTLSYGYHNMLNVVRTDYNISTSKNIPETGYKVALLADTHYGNSLKSSNMQELVDKISAENVDLLLLAGDIVDERTTKEEMREVFEIIGQTKTKYGIYFVYGNHDTSPYSPTPNYTIPELIEAIEGNNITILKDVSMPITDKLTLAGRNDRHLGRIPSSALLENIDQNKFILLMDHQPFDFKENAKLGVDLQVSGHTHGGQIFPIGLAFTAGELAYGSKAVDEFIAIVTSGASGWGYPIRTQANSEYVIINIEPQH